MFLMIFDVFYYFKFNEMNKFSNILVDNNGIISIELGAYGIPETFIINSNTEIIKKYIGPLTNESFKEIEKIIN